jgi:hypothetical protein
MRPFPRSFRRAAFGSLMALLLMAACGRGGRQAAPGDAPAPRGGGASAVPARTAPAINFDATPLYRQMGMIARGLPFPLLGRAAFAASASPDTTHLIVGLTFANSALSFAREADNRFRAGYTVTVAVLRENTVVAQEDATEQLLVGAFRETSRTDESIIHQEILDVTPGRYTLTIVVRDDGSQRWLPSSRTTMVSAVRASR